MISPEALRKARSLVANYGSDPGGLLVGAIAAEIAALKKEAADVVRPFVEYTPDRCFEGNERWKPAVCRDPGGGWYGAEDFRAARSFLDKLEGR